MDQSLLDYIRNSLGQGQSRPDIEQALSQAGWKQQDIDNAFNQIVQNQQFVSSTTSAINNQSQQPSSKVTRPTREKSLVIKLIILFLLVLIGGAGGFLFIKANKSVESSPIENTQPDRTLSLLSPSPIQATQQPLDETCKPVEELYPAPYKKMGFEICYPKNWVTDESGLAGTVVIFKNPDQDKESNVPFNATLNVLVSPSRGYDLDAYINDSKANLPKVFPNYTLVEDKRITLGGKTTHVLGATYTIDVFKIRNSQMVIVEGARVFIVTASALNSAWGKYQGLFEDSMKTFKII